MGLGESAEAGVQAMAMIVVVVLGLAVVLIAITLRRTTSRWWPTVVLLTAFIAVAAALVGSDNGQQRRDDVEAVVEGYADALDLDNIHRDVHHRRTEPGCAAVLNLEESEAWYERNTFSFAQHPGGPTAVYAASVSHFADAGFDVEELKAPLSRTRGLRAVRGDVAVLIDFLGSGANLTVTAGPCAAELSPVDDYYEVVAP